MSYEAVVCRIVTRPHPNADRLKLAEAAGYSCIVGHGHTDGELGVVFPEGGQLSHEFCAANRLYRSLGGYLDETRRVTALKLRGQESNALWLPIDCIGEWLGFLHQQVGRGERTGVPVLSEGDRITEVKGHKLCQKYLTPATIRAMRSRVPAQRRTARAGQALDKHYDTPQLRTAQIPRGLAYVTEKLHGTSGRTGHVLVEQELGRFAKLLNCIPGVNLKPRRKWEVVSGTRNCIVDTRASGERGKGYRVMVHDLIAPHLKQGEVWYYEIVGFEETGAPIMAPHSIGKIGDPKLEQELRAKAGGDRIVYHYRCAADGRLPGEAPTGCKPPRFRVFLYRITQDGCDLTYDSMVCRFCEVFGALVGSGLPDFLSVVPRLLIIEVGDDLHSIARECDLLTRGPGFGGVPIREGVCVRVESLGPDGEQVVHKALKHKGFVFCALEGIRKNDPEYVDAEEVA